MNRRDFLVGNATGLCVGVAGLGIPRLLLENGRPAAPTAATGSASSPAASSAPALSPCPPSAKLSYAQQGEDLILKNVFDLFKIEMPSYIDVGAYDPIIGSNTYLAYVHGSRGVLVEPNPVMCEKLRAVRKGDTVLNAGIGVGKETEADYYVIEGDGQLNTFSHEQVEKLEKDLGPSCVKQVLKLPLLNINDVLARHFKETPVIFSIDAEGMDLPILRTVDFARFRPRAFCVETAILDSGTVVPSPEIVSLMKSADYAIRGGNLVNSVFLDNRFFK
jgi:FkbM family methyltransferase